jgi:nucleotide-binding universal stress UspA family protein
MYDTILVAVDRSEASDRALAAACDLARSTGDPIRLVHVLERLLVSSRGGGNYDLEEPEEVDQLLRKEVAAVTAAGVPVTTELRHASVGHAAREIVDAAASSGAGVIVMGSRGLSELAALLLGSTTFKVLHLADRPVLVVH